MQKLFAPALAWVFCLPPALIAAGDVFYAAPDGVGAGASWADAADLKAAYTAAAAAGGEVWMKAGTYILEEAIPLKSGVAVRGGFAGTEVSADEADPAANQTIVSGDVNGNNKWNVVGGSGLSGTPMWQNGVFTEPNPDGRDDYWHGNINACLSDETTNAFVLAESGPLSGAAFSGITFTGFKSFVFFLGSDVAGGAVSFSDCKFLGVSIGGQAGGYPQGGSTIFTYGAAILSYNVAVALDRCEFAGTTRPLFLYFNIAHEVGATNAIHSCSFHANRYHCIYYGVDAVAAASHALLVDSTVFKHNHSADYSSGAVVLKPATAGNCGATVSFTDCIFEGNILKGGAGGILRFTGDGVKNNVVRCRFTRNVARESNGSWLSVPGIYSTRGNTLIQDCHFVGNIYTNSSKESTLRYSPTAVAHEVGTCDIVNCTFEGNHAVGVNTNACLSTIYCSSYAHIAVANCTFADNVFEGKRKVAAEMLLQFGWSSTGGIINSVFANDAPDYKTLSTTLATIPGKFAVGLSVLPDYGVALTNQFETFRDRGGIATEGAPLAARGRSKGDLLYGRGVSAYAPLLWNGVEVKIASRRIYAFQPNVSATSPWNRLGEDSQVKSIASDPVPDVFGTPRHAGRIAYGPVQPNTTTRLSVR